MCSETDSICPKIYSHHTCQKGCFCAFLQKCGWSLKCRWSFFYMPPTASWRDIFPACRRRFGRARPAELGAKAVGDFLSDARRFFSPPGALSRPQPRHLSIPDIQHHSARSPFTRYSPQPHYLRILIRILAVCLSFGSSAFWRFILSRLSALSCCSCTGVARHVTSRFVWFDHLILFLDFAVVFCVLCFV